LSIVLAALAATGGSSASKIDTTLSKSGQPAAPAPGAPLSGAVPVTAPAIGGVPLTDDPLAAAAAAGAATQEQAPAPAKQGVPLEQ
jgi:hypothetical protein